MANSEFEDGKNEQSGNSNMLSSALIVGCVLALIFIAENEKGFDEELATTSIDNTHYISTTSRDFSDTSESWLRLEVNDSIDGIHITDKDTNSIKLILE
jgi:hypothetical protein